MSASKRATQPETPPDGETPASVAHRPANAHRCRCRAPEPHWTDDPQHPNHVAAIAKSCPLCRAEPGEPCQSITGRPLNRRIHIARTEIR